MDQGVRPALQRPLPRRQELPESRRDPPRGVPAPAGHAGTQAQGCPVLRPVCACLGHPGDPRSAPAGLPRPHVLGRGLQTGRAGRTAVPARVHRPVLGTLRGTGRRGHPPGDRRGLLRLHVRAGGPLPASARTGDAAGGAGPGVRTRRAAARRHRRPAPCGREAGRGPARRHRRRRHRLRRGRAGGRRRGVLRAWRAGTRPAGLGCRQARRGHDRGPRRAVPHPGVPRRHGSGLDRDRWFDGAHDHRGIPGGGHPPRDPGSRPAARRRGGHRTARRGPGQPRRGPRAPPRGQAHPARDGGAQRQAGVRAAPDEAGQ